MKATLKNRVKLIDKRAALRMNKAKTKSLKAILDAKLAYNKDLKRILNKYNQLLKPAKNKEL